MARLLVIEHSSTLAHLLQRTLTSAGYANLSVVNDFDEALAALTDKSFAAVILGVPQRGARKVKPILQAMKQASGGVPLLIVVHHQYHQLKRFASERGRCKVVAWQRFGRIPRILRELMPFSDEEQEAEEEVASRAVRVLLVDDSQSARYAYRKLLQDSGFPVDVAVNVAHGKELAASGDYELFILDYYLPDGTGAELCRHLSETEATKNAVLAIITGVYRENIVRECLEAGAVECMFKNETKELFVARIKAIARRIEFQRMVTAERRRLDSILASVTDGVYGVDNHGIITFINDAGRAILGQEADALVGRPADGVVHDRLQDPETSRLTECYLGGDRVTELETFFRDSGGRAVPVRCTGFPVFAQELRQGSVVVFQAISRRGP